MMKIEIDESLASLDVAVVAVRWSQPLGEMGSPAWLLEQCALDADVPCARSEQVTATVRDVLRTKLYKPRGFYKPASEYLVKAVESGRLGPHHSINVAVDVCNIVSLHSGLPVSVVDRAKLFGEVLQISQMPEGESYVFNSSGQVFELAGLVCLCDAQGACANPVKDSQRTKTDAATRETLYVIWGAEALTDRTQQVTLWLRELLEKIGASHTLIA